MAIRLESHNLVYDDADPRCRLTIIAGTAYMEAIDLGASHARYDVPEVKRYCGDWNWEAPEQRLRSILKWGRKWDELPS